MLAELNPKERRTIHAALALAAAAVGVYVFCNAYVLLKEPGVVVWTAPIAEVRAQFGQLGDFLNPILTTLSLLLLALGYGSQRRDGRDERIILMSVTYNAAVERLKVEGTDGVGWELLETWVREEMRWSDVDHDALNRMSEAQVRRLSNLISERPQLHRPFLLLVQIAIIAKGDVQRPDGPVANLIGAMTDAELLVMAVLSTRKRRRSPVLCEALQAHLRERGHAALVERIDRCVPFEAGGAGP